jgi:hypothetical protein
MSSEAPPFSRALFARLCRGENLILSRNGPVDDADLFRQIETAEDPCRDYFIPLGYRLEPGDGFYFFSLEDEPQATVEDKIVRMIRMVRLLDFLSTNVESFGEGVVFSAATLTSRCQGDSRAERFLHENGTGSNRAEQVESLLMRLQRQGYLSVADPQRQEYRVLSAINYLFDLADRINLREEESADNKQVENHAEA